MTAPEGSAAPAPASSYTPVVTDLVRLVRALFSPGAVFAEQSEKPTFWMPWVLVSIGFACTQLLQAPFQARAQQLVLEAAGRQAPANLATFRLIGVAMTPVITLVMVLLATAILWVAVMTTGEEARYRRLMTATIFAWPAALIQQVVVWVVLRMRGVESIRSASDLQVGLGLDLLLPADSGSAFLRAALGGINPFALWSLTITAVGVMVLVKTTAGKAWTAAVAAFVVTLLVAAGLAGVFGSRMAGG
jgi:hypothetical protein